MESCQNLLKRVNDYALHLRHLAVYPSRCVAFLPSTIPPDPAQRRHNTVQLHAEGWKVSSIAEYLQVSKQAVYTTLKRWVQEGVKGLDDKSHARKTPRKVTLEVATEIRKKQENPLINEVTSPTASSAACRSSSAR